MKAETLEQFKKQVEDELMRRLGIGINDCASDGNIEQAFIDGETANGFVDFIQSKHNLDDISPKSWI